MQMQQELIFSQQSSLVVPPMQWNSELSLKEADNDTEGGITEVVISPKQAGNVQWLLPLLAQLSFDNRWFTWISAPASIDKNSLLSTGIDPNKCLLIKPSEHLSTYTLATKALRLGNCHLAVCWPTKEISTHEYEGLERAAEEGDSRCILIRMR
ncbi:cell division inhibitor SulA [Pokkaliibacter sp. CJK22405]|uniref:cell division inhibitor SulA n=1 Tax=Pokkaliibacter sp. CJK22405 TaxID=3384615 RepID=UPI003984C726